MKTYKFSRKILGVLVVVLFFCAGSTTIPPSSVVNRKVAVVYLKHTPEYCKPMEFSPTGELISGKSCLPRFPDDIIATVQPPRHSAVAYTNKLNDRVSDYFKKVSFNQVFLSFHAINNPNSADGWFEAPHKLWQYNQSDITNASFEHDGIDLAYSVIGDALADYDILLVIHNIHFYPMGYAKTFLDGKPAQMQIINVSTGGKNFMLGLATAAEGTNNEELFMVIGHELGHVHSLRHVRMGPYDLMGDCNLLNHFGGWSKLWAGWGPSVTEMPCIQGPCEITTLLRTLEYKGNNILRIPYVENPFVGYFVECRSQINHDEDIPKEGVLITHIDTITDPGLAARLVFPHGGDDYSTAALSPGDYYLDVPRELMIMYESKVGNDCRVKAVRGLVESPDPSIRKGTAEITSAGNIKHESIDIWIDSRKNGWDYYSDSKLELTGGVYVPTGIGDPFWVGHENRIRFAILNRGYGVAENIQVNVYVDQPVVVTVPGIACLPDETIGGWGLIGTVVIDRLEMGEYYHGFVPWTPEVNGHTQVTVVIENYPGEITEANNIAYETYVPQYSFPEMKKSLVASGVQEVISNNNITLTETIPFKVDKNCPTPSSFILEVFEFKAFAKKDWVVQVLPKEGVIEPGVESEVRLMSTPPDDAKPGDCQEVGFTAFALMEDIYVPFNTVGYNHCVVEMSQLTCSTPQEPLELGSRVQVSGELTPAIHSARIALEYTSPSGKTHIRNPQTTREGTYQSAFQPEEGGKWKVQVFWQGDNKSSPAESEFCYFTVANQEPQFTPIRHINCRAGPGTDYEVITSAGSGDVMEVEARSSDALWLYGQVKNVKCWISFELGTLNVDRWSLPVQQPPQKPTPTKDPCLAFSSEALCNRHADKCKWVTAKGQCVKK